MKTTFTKDELLQLRALIENAIDDKPRHELGAQIITYYATEIDKYAVQTTQHNYPDTMQLGDAFQVRAEDWHLP